MKRDRLGPAVLVLIISTLVLVAWMTRNPDAEVVRQAQEWPVVGGWVEAFRARYLAEPVAERAGVASRDEENTVEKQPLQRGESLISIERGRSVWANKGTRLHERNDQASPAVETLTEITNLPVLDRVGGWYRVYRQDRPAWVYLPEYDVGPEPPLGTDPLAPTPLPGRPADEEFLDLALGFFRAEPKSTMLGEYVLYTDHDDDRLLRLMVGIVESNESFYLERYGVPPIDRPRESILLYSSEQDYRRLQRELARVSSLPAVGLVSRGVVAVFVGGRDREEVVATVVHEVAHLLNRRALGPALPPWLDEGVADDLAYCEVSETGTFDAETLAGSWSDFGDARVWRGGWASAIELQRALAADRLVALEELLSLEWEAFVDPETTLHYPQSAFFVRFMLDSDPSLKQGFERYLQGIAAGEPVLPEALLAQLGRSWSELESEFRIWLQGHLASLTEPQLRRVGKG